MILEFCAVLVFIVAIIYLLRWYIIRRGAKYWPARGVKYLDPSSITSFYDGITFKVSPAQTLQKIYAQSLNHKYVGYMEILTPVLFVRDLDVLRAILVKDFDHFGERRAMKAYKHEPMFSKMLLNLNGQEWKDMRSHLSPTFTTGKIRRMFPLFNSCGHHMTQYLKKKEEAGVDEIDFQDCFGRYTIDAIANIAFGINTDVFEEDSLFRQMAKKMQAMSVFRLIKIVVVFFFPKLAHLLGLKFSEPTSMKFFTSIMAQNMAQRRQENKIEGSGADGGGGGGGGKREDFVQLLLELQAGKLKPESVTDIAQDKERNENFEKDAQLTQTGQAQGVTTTMDDETIMAQSLLFFSAGFDTIETVLIFCAYCLALDPEVQKKLADEVTLAMDQNDGNLTYETTNQMEYLDMVVCETLRLYPPAIIAERTCTKGYVIPGTDIDLPKGCRVVVPIMGIHHDETYYPNSTQFNPDHFTQENKLKRHPYAYLPFGHGPRNCIAMRFAMTEAKAAIAHLVYNYRIEPCEKTQIPVKMAKTSLVMKPEGGMFLRFSARR